ncbi:MAG TPA: aldose epimerase family protein [Candidatus Baltobacteraceae bacterium]|nr:aldose epimerase family protein [Candidatus Baltobacteraceae bacterium]
MKTVLLQNVHGESVTLSTLGAAIASIAVPDARGARGEVTVSAGSSAGKTIGRYANRIARGTFDLDGRTYVLPANEGRNTLHGGPEGFSKHEWQIADTQGAGERLIAVEFSLHSPDGDQGFPGAMDARVRYTWSDDCALRIDYAASTDKPTVVNFTNHVYFNLHSQGEIAEHELQIAASAYTPLDGELIPTGEIASVAGTPFDFRSTRPVGSRKYDVNFAIDGWDNTLRPVAQLFDPRSRRRLFVETSQPGLQLYTGKPGAVALETQHFADAPHHPNFPSTVLRPGERFTSSTIYRFAHDR